jgi:serine/threonine protein phosphatase PrpC
MAITIKNQSFFSEIGKRANNEDNGGWNEGTTYVVCDGVGGNERGEIASEIITNTLLEIYKQDLSISPILSVKEVENQLTQYR